MNMIEAGACMYVYVCVWERALATCLFHNEGENVFVNFLKSNYLRLVSHFRMFNICKI